MAGVVTAGAVTIGDVGTEADGSVVCAFVRFVKPPSKIAITSEISVRMFLFFIIASVLVVWNSHFISAIPEFGNGERYFDGISTHIVKIWPSGRNFTCAVSVRRDRSVALFLRG